MTLTVPSLLLSLPRADKVPALVQPVHSSSRSDTDQLTLQASLPRPPASQCSSAADESAAQSVRHRIHRPCLHPHPHSKPRPSVLTPTLRLLEPCHPPV